MLASRIVTASPPCPTWARTLLGRLLPAGLALALGVPATASAEPRRWPTWPTEVHRISSTLIRDVRGKEVSGERQRVAAIQALDHFATGAILEPLLHALDDSSPQVRREALRMCFEREVVACIPGAANQWSEGGEATVRVAALKVLALDPDPSRAALLIEALRDPSEVIRTQAADYLGSAPMTPDVRKRARSALLAKLADVSVTVRRRAVLSLGLLGPGEGSLSIARLLDDPEPTVRAAAAEALGHQRDDTAVPALRRALASPNEANVSRALINALAVLPDPSVEDDLLALLDDPPAGVDEMQLASSMSRRPEPSEALLQGLVDRLDEPPRRDAALRVLLAAGERARPVLERARTRGLAPAIDVEVERLLASIAPPPEQPPPRSWPAPDDGAGWRHRLGHGDAFGRRHAAWVLAQRDPAWRVPTALAMLATPGPLDGRRAWALTLAGSPSPWVDDHDAEPRARLEGWARDRRSSANDRCLALAALGARASDPGRRSRVPWADLTEDADPKVRACAALALGRRGDAESIAGLLLDDRARVRTAAALGLASIDPAQLHRTTLARLSLLATEDPDAAVRAAATHALAPRPAATNPGRPGLFLRRVDPYAWSSAPQWIEVQHGETPLWLPAMGSGQWRWTLIPGLADTEPRGDTELPILR